MNDIDEVIAAYLRAVDAGNQPTREQLLAAHPQLADRLARFLDDLEAVPELVTPFGEVESVARAPAKRSSDPTLAMTAGEVVRYFGDYELVDEIARGGMGVVYKARQVSLNRPVALKMILSGQLASDGELRRFQREAEAAAALDHPGIVPIHEIGEHEGQHYFAMQLIDGPSLAEALPGLQGEWRRIAELVCAVAEAVHFGHRRGILHRDLKPGNILLDARGAPHVTDFGLAKQVRERDATLTGTGDLLGTPTHMAPEQAAGAEVTTATDVWGLGVVLYQLLAGVVPFRATTPFETLRKVRDDELVPPSRTRPNVPRDLETICTRCLAKDPAGRYEDAGELAADLQRYLAGEPIHARPVGALERVGKWARRRPAAAALIAVSCIALVVAAIATVLFVDYQVETARGERRLRRIADRERRLADDREQQARELVYASNMALAFQSWQQGDTKSLLAQLDEHAADGEGRDLRSWEWHLLRGIASDAVHVHRGGGFVVHAPQQGVLITGGDVSEEIRFRSPENGEAVATLDAYDDVRSVPLAAKLSADGATMATASDRYTSKRGSWLEIRIWDVAGRVQRAAFDVAIRSGRAAAVEIALSDDGKQLAVFDGFEEVAYHDTASGEALRKAKAKIGGAGQFRYTGAELQYLRTFRAKSGDGYVVDVVREVDGTARRQRLQIGLRTPWYHSAWSHDGARIALTTEDGVLGIFDVATGAVRHVREGHRGLARAIAFSADGSRLATGGNDGVVRVWDVASGRQVRMLRGDGESIFGVAFVDDHRLVGVTMEDAFAWQLEQAVEGFGVDIRSPNGARLCFDDNGVGTLLVCRSYKEPFRAMQLPGGSVIAGRIYDDPDGKSTIYLDASADGSVVAAKRSNTRAIHLYRAGVAEPERLAVDNDTGRLAVSDDGTRLAVALSQRGIRFLDLEAGKVTADLEHPRLGYLHGVAFSPDNRWLACCGQGKEELVIVDADAGAIHAVLVGTDRYDIRHAPVFSRDGSLLAVAPKSGGIEVWDTSTWTLARRSGQRTKGVTCLAFSPDDRTLAAGSRDGTVSLFHARTGMLMATLPTHATQVETLAFAPQGDALISVAWGGVRIRRISPR